MKYVAQVTIEISPYMNKSYKEKAIHIVDAEDVRTALDKVRTYYVKKCVEYSITYYVLECDLFEEII
jgi:hypothetical protein